MKKEPIDKNLRQAQNYIQINISYCVWMRNHNTQMAFHCFAVALLLFSVMVFGAISAPLMFLAGCFCFWGLLKLVQGIIDVV